MIFEQKKAELKITLTMIMLVLLIVVASCSVAIARGHGGGGYHSRGHYGGYRSSGIVHVHSYTRRNGTYVHSHDRTHADGTQYNNWSTKGNVNPETGKPGTVTATH